MEETAPHWKTTLSTFRFCMVQVTFEVTGCVGSPRANSVVSRVLQEVGRLTDEQGGPPPFHRIFEAADRRGKGTLPPPAFRRCLLEGLGFELSIAECETLLEYLVRGNPKRTQNKYCGRCIVQ